MSDDYDCYRSWALRQWSGTLAEAVAAERDIAFKNEGYILARNWWAYAGSDVPAFALYTRWQRSQVTIASIAGDGERQGRLPVICDAFEATGLDVVWENVINAPLRYALRRRGYLSEIQEPCASATLTRQAL